MGLDTSFPSNALARRVSTVASPSRPRMAGPALVPTTVGVWQNPPMPPIPTCSPSVASDEKQMLFTLNSPPTSIGGNPMGGASM